MIEINTHIDTHDTCLLAIGELGVLAGLTLSHCLVAMYFSKIYLFILQELMNKLIG